MTRRTFVPVFVAILALALAMLCTSTTVASAQQNPNCCFYTVDIQGVPPQCFPCCLWTLWSCPSGTQDTIQRCYPGNGTYIEPIGNPPLPPCPRACKLVGISLDGINFIGPGETKRFDIGNCCYVISFGFDANGCIYIKITRC